MVHKFTRQALYDLVWSQPMSKLAKNLGVSDVAVAKACRRAEIPVPGVRFAPFTAVLCPPVYWETRASSGYLSGCSRFPAVIRAMVGMKIHYRLWK